MLKIEEPFTSRKSSVMAFVKSHEGVFLLFVLLAIVVLLFLTTISRAQQSCYEWREVVVSHRGGYDALVSWETEVHSNVDFRGVVQETIKRNEGKELKLGDSALASTWCDKV